MKIGPDCIPCILKMCLGFNRRTKLSDSEVFKLFNEVLQIPSLRGENWDITSAHVVEVVMKKTYEVLGDADPLRKEKAKLNRTLLDQYNTFETMVYEATDPLEMAVKLAIIGNSIDIMMSLDFSTLIKSVNERMEKPLNKKGFESFRSQLEKTHCLVYFGDNAGEIVLDKLLISTMRKLYKVDITFVVRSQATLNDVTINEARDVKMQEVARVLQNGIDGPFPGTQVSRCSAEVRDLFMNSELVISKGGGNFDSLEEEKAIYARNISFMLLSKCPLYMKLLKTPLERPILANYYDSIASW